MDLGNVSFCMTIDDVFELNGFIDGVFVTGHIETGTIKPGGEVIIADTMGNIQVSGIVNGIISQKSIQASEKKMLASASEYQDDYWGIALIFHNIEKNDVQNGMFVVIP